MSRDLTKYSMIAMKAVETASKGMHPITAWETAAAEVFPNSPSGRAKACPKSSFLGLAENGFLTGIPSGRYTKSESNKRYAIVALQLLRGDNSLSINPKTLWSKVMLIEGAEKVHNHQMEVVAALWRAKKFVGQLD
jgi:hypothetical protein